jgi:phosphoadenosine phosphosulfate reductase
MSAAALAFAPDAPDAIVRRLSAAAPIDLFQRLAFVRAECPGRLVVMTSFGLEDQAIGHVVLSQGLDIDIVTLDTGRLFAETHAVWVATEGRYGRHIRAIVPERLELEDLIERQGSDGFRRSVEARQACCHVRKVAPLARALDGAQGWITGLRADQSVHRAAVSFAAVDRARGMLKINPLFDWSRDQVADFTRAHDVPVNVLHERGFLSIGCAPCTRAVAPGEPERAGRWWWESEGKTECGLHTLQHLNARAVQRGSQA